MSGESDRSTRSSRSDSTPAEYTCGIVGAGLGAAVGSLVGGAIGAGVGGGGGFLVGYVGCRVLRGR